MSLKIVVLAKQVPDTRNVGKDAMTAEGTVNRAALPAIFNPEDLNALEQALRLKEQNPGSTVGILTMGPPRAAEVIRQGLYRGADTGWLLTDRLFAGADTLATSYALATAIQKIGDVDVVIGGRQAIDGDTAQVGPQVAQKLGLSQVTYAEEILKCEDGKLTIRRHIDGGVETVEAPMPLVVTVTGSAAPCRPANAKLVMKYKRATAPMERNSENKYNYLYEERPYLTLNQWTVADVDGDPQQCGLSGSPTKVKAVKKGAESWASYQPTIPQAGRYAVYVSYQTLDNSIDDATYIVFHKGERTIFKVNQKMGGGTWVYLGTFDFDKGNSDDNRVVVTNLSEKRGIVTTDAVRFGGGMGNIQRGGAISGMPRSIEGARYSAQLAGAPYSVYGGRGGSDDYADDINTRSNMTNWLAGGSVYVPTLDGLKVPIELSLAVHSDAGYANRTDSIIGSLAICTTNFNDGRLNSGVSRMVSHDFAEALLSGLQHDITAKYGKWSRRYLWDRNYSETRKPEMPSAIIETMSHQNFGDMRYGLDPNFRFTMARSLYKTILRYVSKGHERPFVVQP